MLRLFLRLAAAAFLLVQAHGAPVDTANFAETTFLSNGAVSQTTSFAWAPDGSGRLFLTQKAGACYIVQHGFQAGTPTGSLVVTPFMTEPVITSSECGLLGIAFDPDFVNNGYVYFFATKSNSEQQIIRYTASGNAGTNRKVIMPGLPTVGANHDGGGVGIGADGKLYWAVGDNGNKTGVDGNLTTLAAKVGRANRDGSVPNDNPFFDGIGPNNDYIWARGFRNPFTLTFQTTTGLLWVNVVGSSAGGQTPSGPGYEQVMVVRRGDHAGYDDWENNQPAGFLTPLIAYTTAAPVALAITAGTGLARSGGVVTVTTTNITANTHPFRRGGRVVISGAADASFNGAFFVSEDVSHQVFRFAQAGANATSGGGTAISTTYGNGTSGAAISGGTFYDGTAFPAAYRGNFFFGDYVSGLMARATLDAQNSPTSVDRFVTGIGGLIDMATGPDGALYYQGISSGTIRRLATTNAAQNLIVQPTALQMLEAGDAIFTVRLAVAPAGNVTVNVARTAGDADLNVAMGGTLTFTPANYAVPQKVRIHAADDSDLGNDAATFQVSATGLTSYDVAVAATDNDPAQLVLSAAQVTLPEGGTGAFTVELEHIPAGNVTVTSTRSAGDTDVTVSGGAALIFAPDHHSVAQTVTISAAEDANSTNDTATISVSIPGEPVRTVSVTVIDNENAAPVFVSTPIAKAVVNAPYTYDASATGVPAATYSLTTSPAGMTVHPTSGVMSWMPSAAGAFAVAVRATNSAGNITQTYSLVVTADAPPVTSLTRPLPGEIVSGMAEFFGGGEDDVGATQGEFFVDGVLGYRDVNSDGHYHFGGAHLLWNTELYTNGPHTARLRITDTGGQSSFDERQVLVANGADAWRAQHFTLNDPGDLAKSALTADPDGDGLVNLFEYSSDSPPKGPNLARIPTAQIVHVSGADYLAIQFVTAKWATDLQHFVEATGNLAGPWTQIDPADPTYRVGFQDNIPAFGLSTITVRDVLPVSDAPRFIRLRVTK